MRRDGKREANSVVHEADQKLLTMEWGLAHALGVHVVHYGALERFD